MSLGVDVWTSVLVDYNVPDIPPTDGDGNKLYGNNGKTKNAIPFHLSQSELIKIMHCKSINEVLVKLNWSNKWDEKVNQVKLQTFRMRLEILRMSENEIIVEYFLIADEVTDMIRGLGEEVKEDMIV